MRVLQQRVQSPKMAVVGKHDFSQILCLVTMQSLENGPGASPLAFIPQDYPTPSSRHSPVF